MEAANTRKNEEQDRRVLQQRTQASQQEIGLHGQKQMLSRLFAKDYLRMFKRDSLAILVDQGVLRPQKELSMGIDFIPRLVG